MKAIRTMLAVSAVALALAADVKASTQFTFVPASNYSCLTYCTGYFTSDPADTIGYINLQYAGLTGYQITTSVNGKVYQGVVSNIYNGGPLYNADGSYITMTDVNYTYKHTCTHSGRGQTCHSYYFVTDGTVAQ